MTTKPEAKTVAVVGATGAVGAVLLRELERRRFPVGELRALASARSRGAHVRFAERTLEVEEARPEAFAGVDFAFFAATGELSKSLAPVIAKQGGVAIDKSSTWRMEEGVPLVVPEINAATLEKQRGIVACPNCTTIGLVMALEPIRRAAGLRSVVVTTLQAVSGTGRPGIEELERQEGELARGDAPTCKTYPRPIARNALPFCDRFSEAGYTIEEWKLLHETRKILDLPELELSMTCVRVPVPVGHSASVLVETERPLTAAAARQVLAAFPGVEVVDDAPRELFPTARDAEGRDEVLVGRVRQDIGFARRLWLWQVADNLRKGAATNAIQIAEEMIRRGLA